MERKPLDGTTVRSQVINAATASARSTEDRDSNPEPELRFVIESHHAELDALRTALEDASYLEREVEWQREMVAELASRLNDTEVRLAEVEKSHANATALEATARQELRRTRQRIGFILMDSLAQRAYRHRILVFVLIRPLHRFIKRR